MFSLIMVYSQVRDTLSVFSEPFGMIRTCRLAYCRTANILDNHFHGLLIVFMLPAYQHVQCPPNDKSLVQVSGFSAKDVAKLLKSKSVNIVINDEFLALKVGEIQAILRAFQTNLQSKSVYIVVNDEFLALKSKSINIVINDEFLALKSKSVKNVINDKFLALMVGEIQAILRAFQIKIFLV
ncbi:hypothetical protein OROGR_026033 [Orobanche gracilis]